MRFNLHWIKLYQKEKTYRKVHPRLSQQILYNKIFILLKKNNCLRKAKQSFNTSCSFCGIKPRSDKSLQKAIL